MKGIVRPDAKRSEGSVSERHSVGPLAYPLHDRSESLRRAHHMVQRAGVVPGACAAIGVISPALFWSERTDLDRAAPVLPRQEGLSASDAWQ